MANPDQGEGLTLSGRYRIVVCGVLGEDLVRSLGNMRIEKRIHQNGPATVLLGHLRDQAELNGVLNSIWGLKLPVLSVESLSESQFPGAEDRFDT